MFEEMNYNEKKETLKKLSPFMYEMLEAKGIISDKVRGFEALSSIKTKLPNRATQKSAGYDIRANEGVFIRPGEKKAIGTGITCFMQDDEFLDLRIRSGLAFKYDLTLQNDAGVIDSDYYGNEIKVMIRNEGTAVARFVVGDRIAQGIFSKYLLTDDDKPASTIRTDGLGHTGVK